MNGTAARFFRFGAGLLGLVTLAWVLTGQAAKPAHHGMPLPTDWSHRHLIFTQPRTAEQAARLQQDPRYLQQLARRSQRLVLKHGAAGSDALPRASGKHFPMRRDWSKDLGSLGTVGAGVFPGKFSFDSETADCAKDFVVFGTGLEGSSTQATIVAYNNLYSGCGGTVPSVYWAYNTSGRAVTSPVISLDGKQVAFVETHTNNTAELIIVKWQAAPSSSVSSPAGIPSAALNFYHNPACLPCYAAVSVRDTSSAINDTTSSVFYDYSNDIAWVGAGTGADSLLKFMNVFSGGAPAEVATGGFPSQVSTAGFLSSPVFDHHSGNVFIGDSAGFLYSVNSTNGAVTKSGHLDFGAGIVETPIVDLTNGLVYVFASSDGSTGVCDPTAACAAVYQLSTTFGAGDTGSKVLVGKSVVVGSPTPPNPMYSGGFDNAYYSSVDGTGNLYVCGNTGAEPTLYQIPITAGAFPITLIGSPILPALGSNGSNAACSPVSDIANPNTLGGPSERLFVSVQDNGINNSCLAGGCLFNFIDTPWQASTAYLVGQQLLDSNLHIETVVAAGTSGTVVPTWGGAAGDATPDGAGGLQWLDQGILTAANIGAWAANHGYISANDRVRDSNGNIEVIGTTCMGCSSGATEPTWNTNIGGTTPDNTITWVNAGPSAISTLKASGGTSGIIMDNVVSPTTLLGVSQIYFSTLSDQVCDDGTGGCAVQASQPALN